MRYNGFNGNCCINNIYGGNRFYYWKIVFQHIKGGDANIVGGIAKYGEVIGRK